jgi:hypothetical protein
LGFKLFVGAGRGGNPATKFVDGQVQAKVICKQAPKLVEISHLAVKVDNSTEACPKSAVVQVSFSTNRDDRIDFTLEHVNHGRLSITEHFVQPFQIGGQYTASKLIDLIVDSNTTYVEVRLKDGSDARRWRPTGPQGIACPRAFKVTSLWLSYDVKDKDTCPKKMVEKVTGKATAPGLRIPPKEGRGCPLWVSSGQSNEPARCQLSPPITDVGRRKSQPPEPRTPALPAGFFYCRHSQRRGAGPRASITSPKRRSVND